MAETKTLELTDEVLALAGLLGDGASESVTETIVTAKNHPGLLAGLTIFMLECQNGWANRQVLASPTSPTLGDASTLSSQLNLVSEAIIGPDLGISEYERKTYYYGVSPDHPELLYRSDLSKNPFPVPKGRFPYLGPKTANGVFGTRLNSVWNSVAPEIVALLKKRHIRYSAVKAARFSTLGKDGKDNFGPVVIWIAVHPSTTAENAYDASPAILDILKNYDIKDTVVEWYHGVIEKLAAPALLRVADDTNPTFYVRHPFTAALGMPIDTREREISDAQGSVAFFFHENRTKGGEASARVLGVSNDHVLRANTTVDYEFKGVGAARQIVRVAGMRRYQRALNDMKALIAMNLTNANRLALEIVRLMEKPKSEDWEEAKEDEKALKLKKEQLDKVNEANVELDEFFHQISTQWTDISRRDIGFVDWAPKISIDVAGHSYTRDLATFELDEVKFKAQFKGNVVDLGAKYTPHDLTNMFYPTNNSRTVFKFPSDRQLRINGCVPRDLLASPDCFDGNGESCLIVMKYGNTTDLTVGRYAGLEAYICDEFGIESIELAIYNYDKLSGSFSAKGDSGSLVFAGDGRMVGILHSGMPKGASNHVAYATPAWWAVDQLKLRYPFADLNRKAF